MMTKKQSRAVNPMSRRQLLRGLGAAAAALPFMRAFPALADGPALPKVIFFGSPGAFLVGPDGNTSRGYEGWRPAGYGGSVMALPSRLPEIFRPLEPHRNRLLFLEGLRGVDRPEQVGAHQQAGAMLTGTTVTRVSERESYGNGISIDQYIGQRLDLTPLTLAFRIQGYNLGESYWSYLGNRRPVTGIQSPIDAFERVFAGATGDPAAEARRARRVSILDVIARDLSGLRSRLPRRDWERVDQHLESVRAIESDLAAGTPACAAPTGPGRYEFTRDENCPRVIRDHCNIMVQAMACGATRVGSIQVGNLGGAVRPEWSEFSIRTTYKDHAIAHAFDGIDGAGSDGLSRAEGIRLGVAVQSAYSSMFAHLIDRLENTPDADGRPMIDNTIVIHMKPMGRNHDKNFNLHTLAGGQNLGVRGGRFRTVGSTSRPYRYYNDLHTAIAQAMGLRDVTGFGQPVLNREPLDLS